VLTGLEVNLNEQPATPNPSLDASDRSVGFSFVGVHFAAPQSVRYEYRLLPRDTTWSTTAQGFTRYTNLDPGAYQFQVRARLNERTAGEATTYAFRIPAYIYEMRSVQGLAGLMLLMLGWLAYRWRIRRLQRYQQVLEERVQERTTELRKEKRKTEAQAERLAELDDAKNRFFAHVSHEFRTPLSLLLSPLKSALRQASDGVVELGTRQVQRMVRNAEHVQRLIDQLLDLATL
jgi:signal transduction histidine kinase